MNIRLSPGEASLQKWALEHDDESVSDDAAVQLARRDKLSGSFVEYVKRWVPEGRMDSVVFERFASAWDIHRHELAVAQMSEEISVPEDLREWLGEAASGQ